MFQYLLSEQNLRFKNLLQIHFFTNMKNIFFIWKLGKTNSFLIDFSYYRNLENQNQGISLRAPKDIFEFKKNLIPKIGISQTIPILYNSYIFTIIVNLGIIYSYNYFAYHTTPPLYLVIKRTQVRGRGRV